MSFYRTVLAAIAAVAIATPVFAADEAATTAPEGTAATQTTDNSAAPAAAATEEGAAQTEMKVNLNKATAKDLMKVKGLNASKARAIVAYRKKHGDFKSVDELSNVKGFKKMKAEDMKSVSDQLSVE